MARDMQELCPGALLLNYVNPMAMVCWALGTTGSSSWGCATVQTTMDLISGYAGVPKDDRFRLRGDQPHGLVPCA